MANVFTLQDINPDTKYSAPQKGYRLGSAREEELEEFLSRSVNSISELNDCNEALQKKYSDQEKSFKRERKTWSLERKDLNRELTQNNNELQNLRTQALEFANIDKQLRSENINLISRNTQKDRYLADSKAEIIAKTNEIILLRGRIKSLNGKLDLSQKKMEEANYLQSRIRLLKEELFSAQKGSLLKDSEIFSLQSKITELEQTKDELDQKKDELAQMKDELSLKIGEVERLKSDKSIVGGNDPQENKMNSQDEKNLRKYLRKDILEKTSKANTTKMPEVNSELSNLIGDTDSSCKDDTLQNIEPMRNMNPEGNVTPQVAKQINVPNSSLDKSNSELSMGGIEAIPAMASVLGSPKIPWLMITLLIIIVILVRFI
ncbi:7782_t:CDS:1 [Entrophospora sp. SA101]|nr:3252_t:CDS:1 [Entrophospora sp. SA101]CAJ0827483.1 4698_t:CDS:1 [Entrophospora sp. SA101]CAJ0837389.1 7782_t:CDS:1 [Entrophospora sp. SA101]